ncbi:hypothetical protein [Streptomyces sp. NBC_01012]|uniref:hypothetical protein n=1 Tax=Streptomyces sp. NBC_01012 TaxID=2903717 RepID=UPI003862FC01
MSTSVTPTPPGPASVFADRVGTESVIEQLEERASAAEGKIELLGGLLRQLRGDMAEEEFLLGGERIGPYLTCLRGWADRVAVAEIDRHPVAADPRLWSTDRLHTSSLGHQRIAAAIAQAVQLPGSDDAWTLPLPAQELPSRLQAAGAEVRWAAAFLGPWLGRRLRGRSSGDGRAAKRPLLQPLDAAPGSPSGDGAAARRRPA